MPVGANQFECLGLKSYYVCSTGFRGCCSHDPCSSGYCADDRGSSSDSNKSTSTTTSAKVPSRTSPPTITTTTATTSIDTTSTATTSTATKSTDTTSTATTSTESVTTKTSSGTPTTQTATSETGLTSKNTSHSSINGALIGGIVGGIFVGIFIGILIFFFYRRKRKNQKAVSRYDNVPEKTAELDSPNQSYGYRGYTGASANAASPSTLNSSNRLTRPSTTIPTRGEDPAVLLASTPLLPNELPASSPAQPLELPSSVYKPPLPELSQYPDRELINKRNTMKNSLIQPGLAPATSNPSTSTTTPEGAVLRSNLNPTVRNNGRQGRLDPRHHVLSFMSYENRSDTRLGGQINP